MAQLQELLRMEVPKKMAGSAPPVVVEPGQPKDTDMTCVNCHTPVQPGWKFCPNCRTSLPAPVKFCVGCGSEVTPGTEFCSSCGKPISK